MSASIKSSTSDKLLGLMKFSGLCYFSQLFHSGWFLLWKNIHASLRLALGDYCGYAMAVAAAVVGGTFLIVGSSSCKGVGKSAMRPTPWNQLDFELSGYLFARLLCGTAVMLAA